jgi:ATP-dependent DNA helicase PIF1
MRAHPSEGEHYYLKVLLNNVAGARPFEDLRTVSGLILPTFREDAERRGLIGVNTLDEAVTEATFYEMTPSLHWLFATILVFCEPNIVHRRLWEKHLEVMSVNYHQNNSCIVLSTMGRFY